MGNIKSNLKWIYPGLKVKRWLLLALLGIIMIAWGLALILEAKWWTILFFIAMLLEEQYLTYGSVIGLGAGFVILGLLIMVFSFKKGAKSIINVVIPHSEAKLVEIIYEKRQLKRGPKIVVIGGGTGLAVLLKGLKHYTSNLTAVVTVTDDGGCSGKLRGDFGILPPGDIRNNIVALADKDSMLEELLAYRFPEGTEFAGRSLGNLLIAAMSDITGDMNKAIKELSKVLAIRGTVLPSTLSNVVLKAEMDNGNIVEGETNIVKTPGNIKKISIVPSDCQPINETIIALKNADAIILGPGSLYTSIIPNILISEIAKAISRSKANVYYICNVMTQPGETDHYTVSDHIKAIKKHAPAIKINKVVVNTGKIPKNLANKYKQKGASPVFLDEKKVRQLGVKIYKENLVDFSNLVRHDSDKLAKVLMKEILKDIPTSERIKLLDLFLGDKYKDLVS